MNDFRKVNSDSDFICVNITESMIALAKEKAKNLGTLRNSIRKGEGNLAGFLGEMAFAQKFHNKCQLSNSYDRDIKAGKFNVEIKTKDRTVFPKITYECSIANYNTSQDSDFYVFVSLFRQNGKYVKAFILGFMNKKEYFEKSKFLAEGTVDPSNDWKVSADCWNLPIHELISFKK